MDYCPSSSDDSVDKWIVMFSYGHTDQQPTLVPNIRLQYTEILLVLRYTDVKPLHSEVFTQD